MTTPTMATGTQLTCSMCLEVFKKPKILACFHTFCEHCLEALATKHGGKQFLCPLCREKVEVPSKGGVGALQTNFYIDTTQKKASCVSHPDNDIVSFCSTCELTLCVECMLGEHKLHDMKTLPKAAAAFRKQLSKDQKQLGDIESTIQRQMDKARENQKTLQDKLEELRKEIQTRCDLVKSSAEAHRNTELAKLDSLKEKLDHTQDAKVAVSLQETMKGPLRKLQSKVKETLEKGDALQLINLAIKMKTGEEGIRALEASIACLNPQDVVPYPSLPARSQLCAAVSDVIGYLVLEPNLTPSTSDCPLAEVIRCPRQDIYSFSVLGVGDVCVSYVQADAPVQRFNSDGLLVDTESGLKGKVVLCQWEGGECLHIVPESGKEIFCAKRHPIVLERDLGSGRCTVKKIEIKSTLTWTSEWTLMTAFNSPAGDRLVAFDTNEDDETKFAVLLESKDTENRTYTVNIYKESILNPYISLSLKFHRPTDICFYNDANGKEVLLVADGNSLYSGKIKLQQNYEATDILQGNKLQIQPTALRQDKLGRLWIASQDGRIYT